MMVTITSEDYEKLIIIKRQHMVMRTKIQNHIDDIKNNPLISNCTKDEKQSLDLFTKLLEELIA